MTAILADLGGTHLRLAHARSPRDVSKFIIAEHNSIEELLRSFAPDVTSIYLASAIHPRNGIIEDRRFGEHCHWSINLAMLQAELGLKRIVVLNDLEAAAHALPALHGEDLTVFLGSQRDSSPFCNPPKLLIGVGTGIGHAFLFKPENAAPFVQRSHGGHLPVMVLSAEQRTIVEALEKDNRRGRDIIVEDIVSGYGISTLKTVVDDETALRIFWECLGLYCNAMVSICGAYGGIYLTGGVMDELFAQQKMNIAAFRTYFLRPMVPVVTESLEATPVFYCHQQNMPLIGLSTFAEA